ncbi:zinc finger BED domain-containing protein RICESLEEPER 2-like [Tasmannia lanceolata]|uniref:zinc finger BED domain-containing protein RICESLEEPER 2-like n=1 Tax=Tasmannia lanceolata TaxID=3420 RepID=UPI004064212A
MGRAIEKCLKEWGIRKILTCTVDNASADDNLVRWLKSSFSSILGGKFMQMRCVAHIVNLIVCDGLKEYNVSIARIREAIKFVRGSSSRTHKFRECVQMEGIQIKNLLCLDVCTRWNSTYFTLDAAEKFERAFARFECTEPQIKIDLEANNGVGTPTSSDWVAVRRLMVFLQHFYELTNKVSGTSFVTSSNFFQELTVLYDVLFDWKNGNNRDISSMASKMIEKCDKYWGGYSSKMNKLLFVAVVIDPRYKLKFVELAIKEMYQGAAGEVVAEVVKGLTYRLFDEYKNTISPATSVGQSSSLLERVVSDELSAKDRSRAKFRRLQSQVGGGANLTDLDKYLSEGIEEADENFDILRWWSFHSAQFPVLSVMARDLLSIPVSTVASESAFSTGGRVLNPFRSSLTPKIAEALICGSDWVRPSSSSSSTMNKEEEELEEQEVFEKEIAKNNKL